MATNQNQRVLEYLDGEAGKLRYLELVEKAQRMILKRQWCTADGTPPGVGTAEDVVSKVIAAVLSEPSDKGHRIINDDVDIGAALVMDIKSEINHAAVSLENRRRSPTPEPDLHGNTVFDTSEGLWGSSVDQLTTEDKAVIRKKCDDFIEFAKKDKVVHAILILNRDRGIYKPAELIAKELNISVIEVYNARKRLDTLVRKFTQPRK